MKHSAFLGVIIGIGLLLLIGAFLAVTVGIPMPEGGLLKGLDAFRNSLHILIIYGVVAGGFVIFGWIGAIIGIVFWRIKQSSQKNADKQANSENPDDKPPTR